jgi:hypothetical protein
MRKSSIYLLGVSINSIALCLVLVHASYTREAATAVLMEKSEMVKRLELTDLCLFTDARYTRHPAMADMNSAFQDMPMALEHFPSGSLMPPPPHLRKQHGTY